MDPAKACRSTSNDAHDKTLSTVKYFRYLLPTLGMAAILGLTTGCIHRPAAPVALACATAPAAVFPGEPVTVTGTAIDLDPRKHLEWAWTSTAGKLSSSLNTVTLTTGNLPSGTYSVTGRVVEGPKHGESAVCSASFTIKAFEPPTVSCTANPTTIEPGRTSTITAAGVSPQNNRLTYSYAATGGTIKGDGSLAIFSALGAPAGPIGITCLVADDKGETSEAHTTVSISAPAAPPPATAAHYNCSATPPVARPGDPVVLSISPRDSQDSVVWHSAVGVLDSGVDSSVIDTKNLSPSVVSVQADIRRQGGIVGACQTSFRIDPNAKITPWPTLNLVRIPLQNGQQENSGFAVYTYVLYRRLPATDDEKTRFKNILNAIASHVAPEDFGQHEYAPGTPLPSSTPTIKAKKATSRRELAPIIVPVTADGPFTADWLIDHYDPAFASQLLANLNCQRVTNRTNCSRRLSDDGPFLISTLVRLTGHPEGFLVQDLNGTSPEAGGEWVADYMTLVTTKANWVHGYTLQMAENAFAASLDHIGGELQQSAPAVKEAIAFFKLK